MIANSMGGWRMSIVFLCTAATSEFLTQRQLNMIQFNRDRNKWNYNLIIDYG
jgi:glutamyl-tRNA reductase